jgi:hypothetical protein
MNDTFDSNTFYILSKSAVLNYDHSAILLYFPTKATGKLIGVKTRNTEILQEMEMLEIICYIEDNLEKIIKKYMHIKIFVGSSYLKKLFTKPFKNKDVSRERERLILKWKGRVKDIRKHITMKIAILKTNEIGSSNVEEWRSFLEKNFFTTITENFDKLREFMVESHE